MACILDAALTATAGCAHYGLHQGSHDASVTQRQTKLLVLPTTGKLFKTILINKYILMSTKRRSPGLSEIKLLLFHDFL